MEINSKKGIRRKIRKHVKNELRYKPNIKIKIKFSKQNRKKQP
jgi:hypothetical protein